MWVHDLAEATPACGGKAMGLAKLIRAGLPVPEGFAIEDAAFRLMAGEIAIDDENNVGHVLTVALDRILHGDIPEELAQEVERSARALFGSEGPMPRDLAS